MRMLKVIGLLALIAGAGEFALLLVGGPQNPAIPGYRYAADRQVGEEIGRWLGIFLVAAIGAGITAFVTRKREHPYPGLMTGIVLALVLVALNLMAVLQRPA